MNCLKFLFNVKLSLLLKCKGWVVYYVGENFLLVV